MPSEKDKSFGHKKSPAIVNEIADIFIIWKYVEQEGEILIRELS